MARSTLACVLVPLLALLRCGSPQDLGALPASVDGPPPDAGSIPPEVKPPASGWSVAWKEDFEALAIPAAEWQPDSRPDDGPYSDDGLFFRRQGIVAPAAYRTTVPCGASQWLTA